MEYKNTKLDWAKALVMRANRLQHLIEMSAPEDIQQNEKALVEQALKEVRITETTTLAVHSAISDLFFNYDLSTAQRMDDDDQFSHYDLDVLEQLAADVLLNLRSLGVEVPTVAELLADFFDRL